MSWYQPEDIFSRLAGGPDKPFFGFVKLTGAHNLTNSKATAQLADAERHGILPGVYHFAADDAQKHTPEQEAEHFLVHASPYLGGVLLMLDWETHALRLLTPAWALQWLTIVHRESGIVPLIYLQQSAHRGAEYDPIVRAGFPLMHAAYGSNAAGKRAPIRPAATRWPQKQLLIDQYSSAGGLAGYPLPAGLDLDYSHCTPSELRAWAKPRELEPQTPLAMGFNVIPATRPTAEVQEKLGILADGDYGPHTVAHVIGFQENNPPLIADGIYGPNTDKALFG